MPITVSGTQITFNDATTQTTAFTGGNGTVTSVATGNGLQGGTITTSGTLSIACPTYGTVGSYIFAFLENGTPVSGSNYAGGTSTNQIGSLAISGIDYADNTRTNPGGTWKWMGASTGVSGLWVGLACRVS